MRWYPKNWWPIKMFSIRRRPNNSQNPAPGIMPLTSNQILYQDCKVYPLTPQEHTEMDKFINESLAKGYIQPLKSSMASPFFFIAKKSGDLRPYQDYQWLNEGTIKNSYPLLCKDNSTCFGCLWCLWLSLSCFGSIWLDVKIWKNAEKS